MANGLFDAGRAAFLSGGADWDTDTFKSLLVDAGTDTPNKTTDSNLSDIASGARVATSSAMTGMTTTAGVADANDVTFTAVTGASVENLDIFKDTGSAGTSTLIADIDTATGLPLTPNSGDVTAAWDNSANKIFKL